MISTMVAMTIAATAAQADTTRAAREAYSSCLRQFMNRSVQARTAVNAFETALTQECAMRMAMRSAQNIVDFFDGRLDPGFVAVAAPARAG